MPTTTLSMHRLHVLWLVLSLTCGACATISRDPMAKFGDEQLQQIGEKFLVAGDTAQALKFLTAAEKRRPNDPVIQYELGLAYEARGLKTQALAHYQKALLRNPDYSEVHNALGAYYAEQGQLDKAQHSFEKALSNPFYQTPQLAIYNLGRLYERNGDMENALKQYQEAVRLQPNYGLAHFRMGQVLEALRRGDEARRAYGRATEYAPDLAEAHYHYGMMSYMAGELEKALYSLSRVPKLAPHTQMAEEAQRILGKLRGIIPAGPQPASTLLPSDQLAHIEVVTERDLQHQESGTAPKGGPGKKPQGTPAAPAAAAGKPQPHKDQQKPVSGITHWTYVVQVGSFLSRDNAEELQKRLMDKGYDAVIKSLNHQVLGSVYVVQLQPVSDSAKASDLMSQIEIEAQIKPVVIKVPENL